MSQLTVGWPTSRSLMRYIKADVAANPRDPKAQMVLVLLRICQAAMGRRESPRKWSYPLMAVYRFATEFVLGLELRPKTSVGPGISIYHGFGLVVNDHCVIGSGVKLRNGVTIGNREDGGPVPRLGDNVEVGAGAIILGNISLGDGCRVGAGSIVLESVADGVTVVGNPARPISPSSRNEDNCEKALRRELK